jgi:hypothetical protein
MGNPIALVEPNHRAIGAEVTFGFDRDRLVQINYPSKPDVTMEYGAPGVPGVPSLSAGQLVRVIDESGTQEHSYGKHGEITRTIRTVAPGQQGSQSLVFDTSFVIDSLGRQLAVRYPDGVTVTSTYDAGGMLARVDGAGTGWTRTYARDIKYDVFGNRTQLRYGNDVLTTWAFQPKRVRLASVDTLLPSTGSRPIQGLRYKYDPSSNPIEIRNVLPALSGGSGQLPGTSTAIYAYDDVDRLLSATGTAQLTAQKTTTFVQNHSYSASHNMLAKSRTHEIIQPGGSSTSSGGIGSKSRLAVGISDRSYARDTVGARITTGAASTSSLRSPRTERTFMRSLNHKMPSATATRAVNVNHAGCCLTSSPDNGPIEKV